jgi:hypothetical protein
MIAVDDRQGAADESRRRAASDRDERTRAPVTERPSSTGKERYRWKGTGDREE